MVSQHDTLDGPTSWVSHQQDGPNVGYRISEIRLGILSNYFVAGKTIKPFFLFPAIQRPLGLSSSFKTIFILLSARSEPPVTAAAR
jgi:hypothetical protein